MTTLAQAERDLAKAQQVVEQLKRQKADELRRQLAELEGGSTNGQTNGVAASGKKRGPKPGSKKTAASTESTATPEATAVKRGPGRPPGVKNGEGQTSKGKSKAKKAKAAPATKAPTTEVKRGPGRPPGVKNGEGQGKKRGPGRPPGVKNKPGNLDPVEKILIEVARKANGILKAKDFLVPVAKSGIRVKGDLPKVIHQKLDKLVRKGFMKRDDEAQDYWVDAA